MSAGFWAEVHAVLLARQPDGRAIAHLPGYMMDEAERRDPELARLHRERAAIFRKAGERAAGGNPLGPGSPAALSAAEKQASDAFASAYDSRIRRLAAKGATAESTGVGGITWEAMTGAGIDTDLVQPINPGTDEYILIAVGDDLKVMFGPAMDPETGATFGYDVCCRERDDGAWSETYRDWAGTVDELLRKVAERPELGGAG
jgi:hypothetical protein